MAYFYVVFFYEDKLGCVEAVAADGAVVVLHEVVVFIGPRLEFWVWVHDRLSF